MNSANGTSSRVSLALPLQMFTGLVLGLLLALLWPKAAASLQPIGTAFIEAIRMIIIPRPIARVRHWADCLTKCPDIRQCR